MKHVTVQEAQDQFEALIEATQAGETVEITRDGEVIARIQPAEPRQQKFDVSFIREFQSRLTGPVMDTQSELDDWKNESPY